MRILVTGISGQVGAALVPELAGIGSVIGADRSALDLRLVEQIPNILDQFAPDLIVNPAAYTAVDRAEEERETAFLVNAAAPGAIARWAAPRNVPLIHFSSEYVFDGNGPEPWREDDRPSPLSAYGASKLAGEEEIRAAGGLHLIVRTSWVYAAVGTNFMCTIARLARERSELRIVSDQIGAPTSAGAIAKAVAHILAGSWQDIAGTFSGAHGFVHVAASHETSWYGFAKAIVAGLNSRGVPLAVQKIVPIATSDFPTKARRPANSRLNMTRLRSVFGVEMPPWEEALQPELDRLAHELLSKTSVTAQASCPDGFC